MGWTGQIGLPPAFAAGLGATLGAAVVAPAAASEGAAAVAPAAVAGGAPRPEAILALSAATRAATSAGLLSALPSVTSAGFGAAAAPPAGAPAAGAAPPSAILAFIAAILLAMSLPPPAAGAAGAPAAGTAGFAAGAAGAGAAGLAPPILALMAAIFAATSSGTPGSGISASDVEEVLGDRDQVLHVHGPAQQHLHGEHAHEEQQHDHDAVAGEAHLVEELLEDGLRQQARHDQEVADDEREAGQLAQQDRVGQLLVQPPHPDELAEVHVHERLDLVRVPVLEGPEEVPVRPAQEGAEDHEADPQHEEAEQEHRDRELALLEGVVAVALGIDVDVGDRHEPDDDHRGQQHAREPRVVVDEHLLQAQEVPRRLGRVGRARAAGRLLDGRLDEDRPGDEGRREQHGADELGEHEVRPHEHLLVALEGLAWRLAALEAHVVHAGLPQGEVQAAHDREDHEH